MSIRVNRWLSLLFVRLVVAIHRHCRFHGRPVTRVRFDLEFAAEHFGAFYMPANISKFGPSSTNFAAAFFSRVSRDRAFAASHIGTGVFCP